MGKLPTVFVLIDPQCQGCHMPEPVGGYSTKISLDVGMGPTTPSRTPYGQHTLLGGNTHLLEILRDYRTELGIANTPSTAGCDNQIALTRNFSWQHRCFSHSSCSGDQWKQSRV